MTTRVERNLVFDEAKEVIGDLVKLAGLTENEDALILRFLRLCNKMTDCIWFEFKQLDHIEDQIDCLYELVKKEEKGALQECYR